MLTVNSYHHQGVRRADLAPRFVGGRRRAGPRRRARRGVRVDERAVPDGRPVPPRAHASPRRGRSRGCSRSSSPRAGGRPRAADRRRARADRRRARRLEPPRLDDPVEELARPRLAGASEKICSGGPCSRIRPSSRKQTRFAMSRAKPISWVAMTIVMPPAASSRITSSTSATSSGSSAEVTSSSSSRSGLHRERPDDRHPLLLAARQPVGVRRSPCRRGRTASSSAGASRSASARDRRRTLRGASVTLSSTRHVREQVERLEHDPDPAPDPVDVDALGGDLLALDQDPAGVDGLDQVDAAQQRGLAAPRGADERDDLVLGDVEVDPPQHLELAEGLVQALDRQGGHARSLAGAAHAPDAGLLLGTRPGPAGPPVLLALERASPRTARAGSSRRGRSATVAK